MGDYDYVKTLLYVYPKLDLLAEAISCGVQNKALLSFRKENTLRYVEFISEEILKGERLRELRGKMDAVLAKLTEEELYLLEYKYFRRRKQLNGRFANSVFSYSEREYYRRQNALLKKIAFLLQTENLTEKRFFVEYENIAPLPRIYRAVREGKERVVTAKRQKRDIRVQNSSCGEGAFLPRSTKTAIAKRTAAERHRLTICTADGEEADGSSS